MMAVGGTPVLPRAGIVAMVSGSVSSSVVRMDGSGVAKPRFCESGCAKCAPVSLALRSDGSSSCQRSECSSSSLSACGSAMFSNFVARVGGRKSRGGVAKGLEANVAILMGERGSGNNWTRDSQVLDSLRNVIHQLESQNSALSQLRGPSAPAADDVDLNGFDELPSRGQEDLLWLRMIEEARWDSNKEPALASYLYSTILSHRTLERSLAFHLGNKLSSSTLLSTQLFNLLHDTFMEDADIRRAIRDDIEAVKERDPACVSYIHCLLNFKGFLSCQAQRVAHRLWNQGRHSLALAIQSRVSEVFQVDIHPAARIGSGVLFDHATGLVVGETAVIGNNVSILHHVTLGGTGAVGGDRHPKIGDGVLIGAGATILGNISIGAGAKIGAGSIVLIDVPPHTTAVGNPARLIGGKQKPAKLSETPGKIVGRK
uniref:serine O-acetyltransferase n=1 Tax=Physcomitrium patens TaxID=3218 RepID=A0A7I4FUP5_PHYPA